MSSPRLPITDISLRENGEVLCRIAGHPACFHPRFMGDWTDLQAVITDLNVALAEAGGQNVSITFRVAGRTLM